MSHGWVIPAYSRGRVDSAGAEIRNGTATKEDWEVFENWRRAHAYVLNTFQMRLRSRREKFDGTLQVAQRLKRRPTIVDKLTRQPKMNLSRMHDLAGCRAIFDSVEELDDFRVAFLDTRALHQHVNRNNSKFDYIRTPKQDGYRGRHDVFKTQLSSESGERWNGLRVEIQFRTRVQHAWATAVETIDLLNGERAKFGEANPKLQRFFLVASEMLARVHEKQKGFLSQVADEDLAREFKSLEAELRILTRLTEAATSNPTFRKQRNTLLIFHFGTPNRLEVKTFDTITPALREYEKLEAELEGAADIVLVKAHRAEDLRRAFQNYFSDAGDFLELVQGAHKALR